ncbi:MAG: hypothetical protein KatS3mg011_1153 [Acidimicrobiia bacterium]|nr:MAG: hypothetical protein KatS3mg011_1153 [Acidimicrobiia bacterium]
MIPLLLLAVILAPQVGVDGLDREPDRYDGRMVTIEGEAVGDYGRRGSEVWIQINDDPYRDAPLVETGLTRGPNRGIGVWMDVALFQPDRWGPPGRYGLRGPILRITGVFHHNDPERGGETYLEAVSVELVEGSRRTRTPGVSVPALAVGAGLAAVGIGTWSVLYRRRRNPITL